MPGLALDLIGLERAKRRISHLLTNLYYSKVQRWMLATLRASGTNSAGAESCILEHLSFDSCPIGPKPKRKPQATEILRVLEAETFRSRGLRSSRFPGCLGCLFTAQDV